MFHKILCIKSIGGLQVEEIDYKDEDKHMKKNLAIFEVLLEDRKSTRLNSSH